MTIAAGQKIKALDFTASQTATDFTNLTNLPTTAATGSPVVSLTFTAPTSGKVQIVIGAFAWDSSTVNEIIVDYELYLGTSTAGTLIVGTGNWERRLSIPCAASANTKTNLSRVSTASGLTPGSTYFIQMKHFASIASAGSNIITRRLDVFPLPA